MANTSTLVFPPEPKLAPPRKPPPPQKRQEEAQLPAPQKAQEQQQQQQQPEPVQQHQQPQHPQQQKLLPLPLPLQQQPAHHHQTSAPGQRPAADAGRPPADKEGVLPSAPLAGAMMQWDTLLHDVPFSRQNSVIMPPLPRGRQAAPGARRGSWAGALA